MAPLLGARPDELTFTSGATEAIQLILRGYALANSPGHLITSNVEHPAVAQTLTWMQRQGWEVTYLPVGLYGAVQPEQVIAALQSNTKALVLMAANNETGVISDLPALAEIALQHNLFFFVDAVAALGRMPISFLPGISAMAFSSHKIHAPHGAGLALLRRNLRIEPLLLGGGQESKKRSGTENIAAIVAFAHALTLTDLATSIPQMLALRTRLETSLQPLVIHGAGPRLCNTLHAGFPNADAETLLILLDQHGVAASHGSACSAGSLEPSATLLAMGVPLSLARSSLRFSLSRLTTSQEVDHAIAVIQRLR
jgi:cysteine desulfurase